jgi:hypothetical protein
MKSDYRLHSQANLSDNIPWEKTTKGQQRGHPLRITLHIAPLLYFQTRNLKIEVFLKVFALEFLQVDFSRVLQKDIGLHHYKHILE